MATHTYNSLFFLLIEEVACLCYTQILYNYSRRIQRDNGIKRSKQLNKIMVTETFRENEVLQEPLKANYLFVPDYRYSWKSWFKGQLKKWGWVSNTFSLYRICNIFL